MVASSWLALLRGIVVVLCLGCFVGCSTTELMTRPQPAAAQGQLKTGDKVMIELVDGSRFYAVVQRLTPDALVTGRGAYAWGDIRQVEVQRFSGKRTLLLAGGIVVVLAAVVAYGFSHMDIHLQ